MIKKISILFSILMLLASCAGSTGKGDKLKHDYRKVLEDSVKVVEREIDSCQTQMAKLNTAIGQEISNFTEVKKPREVEGYYILKGWSARYPLTSTGIIARISLSEQLELIAMNSNQSFDAIAVRSGEYSAQSAVVPHDQALNYRNGSASTVMFSGKEADGVAETIANNELNPVTLLFLQNGKPKGSIKLSTDTKKMISATWLLYSHRRKLQLCERMLPMLTRKMQILQQHIDK